MSKFDDTHARSMADILDTAYTRICVPQFQRDYSWDSTTGRSQTEELWNDLSEKYVEWMDDSNENIEYLLGPMVFIKNAEDHTLEIVDGQQRLATLTILLSIIRDLYHESVCDINSYDFNDSDLTDVYDLIEQRNQDSDNNFTHKNWRLELNSNDKEKFEDYVQRYIPQKFSDSVAQPGDKFRKISDKIKYLKKELKNKETKESWKKIINSYLFLHEHQKQYFLFFNL